MTTRLTQFSALALCLTLAACKEKQGGGAAQQQRPPAMVTVTQPTQREVVEHDEYPARFEPVDMVEVRARVSGYLQSVNFKDGAEVKKGDVLFVIDPRQYQAELNQAEANAKEAQSRLDLATSQAQRSERLLKAKAISEEESDTLIKGKSQAEAALASAQAQVETAKLNVEYTHITSPINGRIGRKMMTEGNLINGSQGQSSMLTTIVSMDPIYCSFDADESSVLRYQKLAREKQGEDFRDGKVVCEAGLANETGFPHQGVLDFADNMVDSATGTLHVRGIFPNPDHVLQPGFFARIRVPGSMKYNALLIPDPAVGTDQGQKFVYVVNSTNVVEYRKVTLGPMIDNLRAIRDGIKPDDKVITSGVMSVRPGAPVTITPPSTNAPAATPAKS